MKVLLADPKEDGIQNLAGVKKYLDPYTKVEIEQQTDCLRIKCPPNFVNGIISLVEKYGYWVSKIQDAS